MEFSSSDKNRYRFVAAKCCVIRYRFAAAIAKCLVSLYLDTMNSIVAS